MHLDALQSPKEGTLQSPMQSVGLNLPHVTNFTFMTRIFSTDMGSLHKGI